MRVLPPPWTDSAPPQIDNKRDYWGRVMSMQYLFFLTYNSFYSYNILTILGNLDNKYISIKKDQYIFIIQYIFWKHYSVSLQDNLKKDICIRFFHSEKLNYLIGWKDKYPPYQKHYEAGKAEIFNLRIIKVAAKKSLKTR